MNAEQPLEIAGVQSLHAELEHTLAQLFELPDEQAIDVRWSKAMLALKAFTVRPAKRVRPTLLVMGWAMAAKAPAGAVPQGVKAFAAALELLHTFMLIHDDVADRAMTRRGGLALHRMLGGDAKSGEDLAVVLGDHLYSRAVEVMLSSGAPRAAAATRYMMEICRHTAVGQFLDLDLSRAAVGEVTLFQTLKVAHLKTAKYGFVAPLVVGAMLGGGGKALLAALERVGRAAGMAYQLRDDLIGLFGSEQVAGKDGGADYVEGKRTFPLIAAWTRASADGRERLETLWQPEHRGVGRLEEARAEIEACGGRAATERVIDRMERTARKNLELLPNEHDARDLLDAMLTRMVRRAS